MPDMHWLKGLPLVANVCGCSLGCFEDVAISEAFAPQGWGTFLRFWVVNNALGFVICVSSFLNVSCFSSAHRKSLPLPVGLLRLVSHGNRGVYPEIRRILTKRASWYTSNMSSLWGFSERQTSSNGKRQY